MPSDFLEIILCLARNQRNGEYSKNISKVMGKDILHWKERIGDTYYHHTSLISGPFSVYLKSCVRKRGRKKL